MASTESAAARSAFQSADPWQPADAAADERRRISRDIHDSAIQPYIGLKFALEALARKVAPDNPLYKDISRLVEMTSMEIAGLRRYIKGLRGQLGAAEVSLGAVLRPQAARFAELYDIKVTVEVGENEPVDDWFADEIAHIVREALSNIRRHTNASFARVKFSCDAQKLALEIINPRDRGVALNVFTPRSISERAHALGGRCWIETGSGRYTVVFVEIPLRSRPV